MSEQKAEQTSVGVASAETAPKTSASPDVVDNAVPAIAPLAQAMIAPDHEAPAADRPSLDTGLITKAAVTNVSDAPEAKPALVVVEAARAVIKAEVKPELKAETKPAAKFEPVKADVTNAEPATLEPEVGKAEPKRLDLVKSDKSKADKVRPETAKAEAIKADSIKPSVAKADQVKANAGQSAPNQSVPKPPSTILDLIRTEPVKSEPIRTAAAAGDLLRVETPKLSALATNAPKIGPMAATASKSEAPIKPDAPSKPVAAAKPETSAKAEVKPEAAVKAELSAKPDPFVKPEPVVKQEAPLKRPVVASEPAINAGAAAAVVDKAAAWARAKINAKLNAEPFKADTASQAPTIAATGAGAGSSPPQPGKTASSRIPVTGRLGLPAAAAILLVAMVVGGVAGGLVTATLVDRSGGGMAETAGGVATDGSLGATVSRIENDVAALKASLDQTNQTSLVELNKSAERLDRLEKVLGELATKSSGKPSELQRLSEAVDRLRAAQASAASQAAARDNTASVPQAVGAINAAAPPAGVASRQEASRQEASRTEPVRTEPSRTEASRTEPGRTDSARAEAARAEAARAEAARAETNKPKVVEGWVLRDVGRGGALIEGRGGLYEVYAGDPVPGLGKVDAIRKQDGRWVVFTTKGLVVSR